MLGMASIIGGALALVTNREKEIKTRINIGTKVIISGK
jgi:hypothetical protein